MGNLVQSSTPMELEKKYKVVKQGHQDLTLLQQLETGNQFCLKCFMFNSNQGLQACVQKLNGKKRINHQHILAIKQIYSRSQNTFCSNVHKVYAIIEYPFRTLSEEIAERKRSWDYFSETELWSIIYSCSMALNYLYSTNLTHGCLTSNRIYIENDGLIKISDPSLFNESSNMIGYVTNSNREHVYVSPEQLEKVISNNNQDLAIQSSDVFILGVIILEAIHLQGMGDIYDNGINYKTLAGKINSISNKYSEQLKSIVERMLVGEAEERISFEEIETIIQNNNFDEESVESEESSRRNSISSRRPLDSIPSNKNAQNVRDDSTKPFKALNGGESKEFAANQNRFDEGLVGNYKIKSENQVYYSQNYVHPHPAQVNHVNNVSQIKKAEPLAIYSPGYQIPTNLIKYQPNYNIPSYTTAYYPSPSFSPTSQYTNSWNLNTSVNTSTNNIHPNQMGYPKFQTIGKPIDLPTYEPYPPTKLPCPPNLTYFQTQTIPLPSYNTFQPHKVIQPVKMDYDPGFLTSSIKPTPVSVTTPLPEYKHQPLNVQKLSIPNEDTLPVERLDTIEEAQEIQTKPARRIIHDHPNSIIAEVTETEISGVESPRRQEEVDTNAQPQYVNQDSQSGSHYQGYKLNGKKHGFGRLYYQDGGYYEGQWKFNKMNGFAKLYYQSGDIAYEGYWVNDKLHGKGKVFNDNPIDLDQSFDYKDFTGLDDFWQFYDGEFAMDAKQGFGTIKLTNGQIFEGQFDKDVIEGRGKFYALNGKIISGIWKQNKLVQTVS